MFAVGITVATGAARLESIHLFAFHPEKNPKMPTTRGHASATIGAAAPNSESPCDSMYSNTLGEPVTNVAIMLAIARFLSLFFTYIAS